MNARAISAIAGLLLGRGKRGRSMPEGRFDGLVGQVEAVRDSSGTIHVRAQTRADMYFAQGVFTAHDRLWQMDLVRRVAEGRLAEILGEAALPKDRIQRELRLAHMARQKARSLSKLDLEISTSYLAGVNAYVESLPANRLPVEFRILGYRPEPFTVEDVLAAVLMRVWMNTSWPADCVRHRVYGKLPRGLARLLFMDGTRDHVANEAPEVSAEHAAHQRLHAEVAEAFRCQQEALDLLGLGDPDTGSGTFTLAGARTASGKPLLALDAHQGFVAPNFFYPIHLTCPDYDVAGVALPMVPGICMGHSQHIAWGSIVFLCDNQDVFIEELVDDQQRYMDGDGSRPLDVVHEVIQVKGRRAPVEMQTYATHRGLILKSCAGWGLAIANVCSELRVNDLAYYDVGRARDFNEFRRAFTASTNLALEVTYMDRDDNIGYLSTGLVPIRRGHDGSMPVMGRGGRYDWEGFLDAERLSWAQGAADGYFNCANHKNPNLRRDVRYGTRWHPVYRAMRTEELITSHSRHTVETVARIQADQVSLHARFLIPYVLEHCREPVGGGEMAAVLKDLAAWDCELAPDSYQAVIYYQLAETIKRMLILPFLGEDLYREYIKIWPSVSISVEYILAKEVPEFIQGRCASYGELCRRALEQAMRQLRGVFGEEDYRAWRWGKVHQIRFKHPLGASRLLRRALNHECEVGGDGEVVFSARSIGDRATEMQSFADGRRYPAVFGSCFRYVLDAGDWDRSHLVLNLGVSGDPLSPYYRNHASSWLQNAHTPFPYSAAAVDQAAVERTALTPCTPPEPMPAGAAAIAAE